MSSNLNDDGEPRRIAILGIGLLGGSVGLAVRRRWPDVKIAGYSRRAETRQQALDVGAVSEIHDSVAAAVRDAELIFVSTPVHLIADQVIEAARYCPADALITDVGSTKAAIVSRVTEDQTASRLFVGGHPIAGGDKTGPTHAKADLFDNRLVVLTPMETTDLHRLEMLSQFWRSLHANVVVTTPADHDDLLAATSHLPHLVAAVLASLLTPEATQFVGPGWRDTTRVAAGCPDMWTAICQENNLAIAAHLERMIDALQDFKNAVHRLDTAAIKRLLETAKEKRNRQTESDL